MPQLQSKNGKYRNESDRQIHCHFRYVIKGQDKCDTYVYVTSLCTEK